MATNIIDCRILTFTSCRSIEIAFRTMTINETEYSLNCCCLWCVIEKFWLHVSSIDQLSHVSFPTKSYDEFTCFIQYSNCAVPSHWTFTKNSSPWFIQWGLSTVKLVTGSETQKKTSILVKKQHEKLEKSKTRTTKEWNKNKKCKKHANTNGNSFVATEDSDILRKVSIDLLSIWLNLRFIETNIWQIVLMRCLPIRYQARFQCWNGFWCWRWNWRFKWNFNKCFNVMRFIWFAEYMNCIQFFRTSHIVAVDKPMHKNTRFIRYTSIISFT